MNIVTAILGAKTTPSLRPSYHDCSTPCGSLDLEHFSTTLLFRMDAVLLDVCMSRRGSL